MAYSAENFTENCYPYLVTQDELYVEGKNSEQWAYRFEVPYATYVAGTWAADNVPSQGTTSPLELSSAGVILHRQVRRREMPGFVVVILVCGWNGLDYFDSLTRVSVRPVSVRKRMTLDTSGDPLDGPVGGHEEDQRYAVSGDQDDTETYYQITVISVVTPTVLGTVNTAFSGNDNNRNSGTVSFNGLTYATGSVKFVGMGSEDIVASQSPTGSAAYRVTLSLLATPGTWRNEVTLYTETRTVQKVPVKSAAVAVGHARIGAWVRASSGTTKTIRGEFDMNAALDLLP